MSVSPPLSFHRNETIATLTVVVRVVASPSRSTYDVPHQMDDKREETQYFPFRFWVNTRTKESDQLKYLQILW
jgi:hypothetical protein